MKRLWVFGLVVVLVGAAALFAPAVADAQAVNGSDPAETVSFDETEFVVTVYENGSARWTQRYNQPLSNDTQLQRFRAYADRFEGETLPVYTDFRQRAARLTADAANATGREMAARAFTRDANVVSQPSTTGVVEMSFRWENFTAVDDGRVLVGDAFASGLYLSPGMALELRAGPDLEVDWESVEPTPDASNNGSGNATDSLTYFGERQFAGGQPRVAFGTDSPTVVGGSSPFGFPAVWVIVAGALLAVGVVVVRSGVLRSDPAESQPTNTGTRTNNEAVTEAEPAASPATPPDGGRPVTLRSDEDRVAALLESNDGRMQQATIVEETGWSKAKVSTVLSGMAESGRISKLRVGRENVVSLSGYEPEAAGSPFEDG